MLLSKLSMKISRKDTQCSTTGVTDIWTQFTWDYITVFYALIYLKNDHPTEAQTWLKNYTLKKCSNLWIIFCSIWTLYLSLLDVIYQTWGKVFHLISKHWEVVEKMRCSRVFFNQLQGVWISDETPFQMFDIASQTINNSWRKSKQKFTKFYDHN